MAPARDWILLPRRQLRKLLFVRVHVVRFDVRKAQQEVQEVLVGGVELQIQSERRCQLNP